MREKRARSACDVVRNVSVCNERRTATRRGYLALTGSPFSCTDLSFGAGGTLEALVHARTALASRRSLRALADENRRRADADAALKETIRDDASDASGSTLLVNSLDEDASASSAPLLRLDETSPPPSSPAKPRKRERGCWCRG